jgi:hypothetical protein
MAFDASDVITRLHPDADGCYFQLGNERTARFSSKTEPRPLDRYFHLRLDHPNYSSLFQVAMHAAFLQKRVVIRTKADIDPAKTAEVEYLYVEFEDE